MLNQLRSCVVANFRYYRRNYLMFALMGLAVLLGLLIVLPKLYSGSGIKPEDYAGYGQGMNVLVMILIVIASLITVSQERRSKTLKTVLSRPCSVATRLLSHWISLLTVGLGLLVLHHLSFYWLLSQAGLTYGIRGLVLFFYGLCVVVIGLSVSIFYASFLHPVLAGILTLVTWDVVASQLLIYPILMIGDRSSWEQFAQTAFDVIHTVLPAYTPYVYTDTSPIGTLVIEFVMVDGLAWSLTKVFTYTLVTAVVSFVASRLILERQNLI